jgi:hypothetical protein
MVERVDDLLDMMRSFPVPEGHYPLPVDEDMRSMLLEGTDEHYISKLKTLFQTLASGGRRDLDLITEVLDVIMIDDVTAMTTVCDNLDYLREEYPSNNAVEVIQFWSRMVDRGMVPKPVDGEASSLGAHCLARTQYGDQVWEARQLRRTKPDEFSDLGKYPDNRVYIAAVERHSENIDKLIAYRELRGAKFVDGKDTFNEEDFQKYLEQGPVAEGWL